MTDAWKEPITLENAEPGDEDWIVCAACERSWRSDATEEDHDPGCPVEERDQYRALLGRLLAGNSWILANDAETRRATFVTVGIPNGDLDLGDELQAVAARIGVRTPLWTDAPSEDK